MAVVGEHLCESAVRRYVTVIRRCTRELTIVQVGSHLSEHIGTKGCSDK